ncbi:MAG: gliding motility-associated C-terminal domain-containing protein [Flavobacteriales bacterium]
MTGVISNARDCSPAGSGENPYDIIFSPDNNRLYISSTDGKLGSINISSVNSATMTASFAWVPGIGPGSHSSLEMGGDGNLYMASSGGGLRRITGNINAGTGLTRSASLASSNLGLPTMYLPPQEEPDIQEVGPFCDTDGPVDLSTKWLCSGLDAEDPSGTPPSVYTASRGACINAGTGVFSPAVAGEGNHRIIFTKCSVDDTIFIQVNSCSCPDTTLSNISPICVESTVDLATKKVTTAAGTWSIQGSGANWPTLVGNIFTTTATTAPGNYTVRYTLTPDPGGACPKYTERIIKVNGKPTLTFTTTPVCEGSASLTFNGAPTGGVYSGTGITGATFNPTTPGTTAVTYTYTDANTCTNTITTNQVVNAKPAVTFTTSPGCEGSAAITFNGSPTGGVYSGAGITGATFNPTTPGTTAVTYTYTDANSFSNSDTANQVVNAKPVVTFTTTPVCEGSAALTFNGAPTGGVYSGTGITGATFNPTTPGTTAVTYTYTDNNNCSNAVTANQVVNAKPLVTFTTSPVCEGSATLTFNGAPAGGVYSGTGITGATFNPTTPGTTAVTYTYTDNNCSNAITANQIVNAKPVVTFTTTPVCEGSAALTFNGAPAGAVYSGTGITGASFTPSTPGTTAVTYTYTDGNGCINAAAANQVVNAIPTVTFTTTPICEGAPAITFNGAPAGGVYSGTGITGATFDPTAAGTIAVTYTYTDNNNCSNAVTTNQVVNAKPVVTFTTSPVCEGSAIITFNGAPSGGVYSGTGITGATFDPSMPGTTAVTYTYTDNNSCSNAVTVNQVVNALPTVTFTTSPVCEGSAALTFNGAPTGGVYSGTGITGATFTPSTPGTTAVTYTYTDGNGCINAAAANQVVNANPVVSLSPTSICPGSSTTLDAGSGFASYSWSPNGETTQTLSVNAQGTYTVTVTNAEGCTASSSSVVSINPNLNIDLGLNDTICVGNTATFTANYANAGVTYTWSGPAGYTNITQAITVNTAGTYHVDVVDPLGCTGEADVDLVVNPLPVVTFTTTPVCEGSAAFTFNGAPAGGVYSGPGISGATFNPAAPGSTAVTYTYTDGNGCINSTTANQVVNSLPTVTFTTTPVCEGSAALTFNGAPAGGVYSGTGITGATFNPTTPGTTVVTYTYTDANSCTNSANANQLVNAKPTITFTTTPVFEGTPAITFKATPSGGRYSGTGITGSTFNPTTPGTTAVTYSYTDGNNCSNSITTNQVVNAKTALTFNTNPACVGSTVTFAASPAGGVYSGTGITGTNYSASAAGNVQVTYTYTNADGCISTITSPQVVNANPVVNLSADKSDCDGQTITFDGTTSGAVSYSWTPSGTGPTNAVTTAGTYTLTVTDANGCIGSDNVVASFIAIPSLNIGPDVDLCPNESATITAIVNPSTSVVTWSNKTSGLSTTVNQAEVIIATANNGGLCSATDNVNVFMHEIPDVENMKDTTLCFLDLPQGYVLDAGAATTYSWNTKENTSTITISRGGSYAVAISNEYGCQATETVTILEDCPSSLFVPTAFTPNEDGLNDIFFVKGDNIYDFELYVFNRWGEVIFHSTDMNNGWNGKRNNNMQDAQIDVYVWKVTYKYWKDVHEGGRHREPVGTVSLIK